MARFAFVDDPPISLAENIFNNTPIAGFRQKEVIWGRVSVGKLDSVLASPGHSEIPQNDIIKPS